MKKVAMDSEDKKLTVLEVIALEVIFRKLKILELEIKIKFLYQATNLQENMADLVVKIIKLITFLMHKS
jgi:hypothetical protein